MQINSDWIAKSSESNESEWGRLFLCMRKSAIVLWAAFEFFFFFLLFIVFSLFSPHAPIQTIQHIRHESNGETHWMVCIFGKIQNVHHFYHRYGGYIIISVMLAPTIFAVPNNFLFDVYEHVKLITDHG